MSKTDKELEDETFENDIAWLMDDPRGRRVVWDLLDKCGVFATSFTTNGSMVMFKEGRRDVGLRLMHDIEAYAPETFMKMWNENVSPELFESKDGEG